MRRPRKRTVVRICAMQKRGICCVLLCSAAVILALVGCTPQQEATVNRDANAVLSATTQPAVTVTATALNPVTAGLSSTLLTLAQAVAAGVVALTAAGAAKYVGGKLASVGTAIDNHAAAIDDHALTTAPAVAAAPAPPPTPMPKA